MMEQRSKKVARFQVEKASYFSQHDIVYEVPPGIWQDGFPMGNGDVCALAYIPESFEWGITKVEKINQVFEPACAEGRQVNQQKGGNYEVKR